MIKLATNCEKCIHKKVCNCKDNAKYAMERLKKMQYGKGPNNDYDWETMMKADNVDITFSCPDYIEERPVPRKQPFGNN